MARVLITTEAMRQPMPEVCVLTGETHDLESREVRAPWRNAATDRDVGLILMNVSPLLLLLTRLFDRKGETRFDLPMQRGAWHRARVGRVIANVVTALAAVAALFALVGIVDARGDSIVPMIVLNAAVAAVIVAQSTRRPWPRVLNATAHAVELDLPSDAAAAAIAEHVAACDEAAAEARERQRRRARRARERERAPKKLLTPRGTR